MDRSSRWEAVLAPRDKTMHKRKVGWSQSTIRAILYNERYTGAWTFNERRWVKIPGTNKRRCGGTSMAARSS